MVEHLFSIKQVLSVTHIHHSIFLVFRVVVRQPDIHVSGCDKPGLGLKCRIEIKFTRRYLGLVGMTVSRCAGRFVNAESEYCS